MKRSFYLLLIMAVATVAACTKPTNDFEDERLNPASSTYTYTITASNGDLATKSDYDAEGHFKWSAGDAISVLFHNNDAEVKNKFFTLTLVSGAGSNTATFSGEIDNGYTIGASDGTAEDKKIWALFPASDNHTYTEGSNPTFYVQPSADFTTTHFSANIPMCAMNKADGALSFENLSSTYKFTVKNIKNGVDKVIFRVYNQKTYGLSGSWPIGDDKSVNLINKFLDYGWASSGSANSTLTYISEVTNNTAVFYVSCRYYGNFQPVVTVANYSTGVDIKSFTAGSSITPSNVTSVKPITIDVSDGNYYTPAITIDGNLSDWSGITAFTSNATSRIREWKIKTDPYFVYVYAKLRKDRVDSSRTLYIGFETDNDETTGTSGTYGNIPAGLDAYARVIPFTNAIGASVLSPVHGFDASSKTWSDGHSSHDGTVYVWDYDDGSPIAEANNAFIELSIPRSELNLPASGSTITVNISYENYVAGAQTVTLE